MNVIVFKVDQQVVNRGTWCLYGIMTHIGCIALFVELLSMLEGTLPVWVIAPLSMAPSLAFFLLESDQLRNLICWRTIVSVSIYYLLVSSAVIFGMFAQEQPRGWQAMFVFLLIGMIPSILVLRVALRGKLAPSDDDVNASFISEAESTPYYLAVLQGAPELEPMLGQPQTEEDLFVALNVVEKLYFSPVNPWHPLFGEMMNAQEGVDWHEERTQKEPAAAMSRWMSGASDNELNMIAKALRDSGSEMTCEYTMAVDLLLAAWARERRTQFVDLLLPLMKDEQHLQGAGPAIIDAAAEEMIVEAIPRLEALRDRVDEDSRDNIDRALKVLRGT